MDTDPIQEAQKHTDPHPQHWFEHDFLTIPYVILYLLFIVKSCDDRFVDSFYDTSDFLLLRKGIWLRQRQGHWQTRQRIFLNQTYLPFI